MSSPASPLSAQVRHGLAWSTLNNLALRMGSLALGIVLARLLTPQQFGIYAVALTVQAVLMTLADLGLSADLIRCTDPERRRSTVATLGLTAGTLVTTFTVLTARPVASLLGTPQAASVIVVLAFTLLLAGAGVVPYAMLTRRFDQKRLLVIALVDFAVGSAVTIGLLAAGAGVISLAIGRVVAQGVTLVLQFWFSGTRPLIGIDRAIAASVLAFGIPVAGANVLSWALISADNVVIARMAGPVALGAYVLAFNVSSWPMTAIGQVVRSVALPGFSRVKDSSRAAQLSAAAAVTWAAGLAVGLMLAALARPLVEFVYGARWRPAAPVLAALGLFGALRVLFDLVVAALFAAGASRSVLWIQVLWFVVLVPALALSTRRWGIVGAGWAHLAVAAVVVLPAYALAVRRLGVRLRDLVAAITPPLVAAVPAGAIAAVVAANAHPPVLALLLGGSSGMAAYTGILHRWFRRCLRRLATNSTPGPAPTPAYLGPLRATTSPAAPPVNEIGEPR